MFATPPPTSSTHFTPLFAVAHIICKINFSCFGWSVNAAALKTVVGSSDCALCSRWQSCCCLLSTIRPGLWCRCVRWLILLVSRELILSLKWGYLFLWWIVALIFFLLFFLGVLRLLTLLLISSCPQAVKLLIFLMSSGVTYLFDELWNCLFCQWVVRLLILSVSCRTADLVGESWYC